jgi:hypothetical protein
LNKKSAEEICRPEIFLCKNKVQTTVTNVFIPWAPEELKNDLKCANFVTVPCNASNHKHEKQLQILVVIIRCTIWKTQ